MVFRLTKMFCGGLSESLQAAQRSQQRREYLMLSIVAVSKAQPEHVERLAAGMDMAELEQLHESVASGRVTISAGDDAVVLEGFLDDLQRCADGLITDAQALGELGSEAWRRLGGGIEQAFEGVSIDEAEHVRSVLTAEDLEDFEPGILARTPLGEMRQAYVDGVNREISRAIAEGRLGNGFTTVKPTLSQCQSCRNHHGKSYGGSLLVCAIHPSGYEGDECEDFESIPADNPDFVNAKQALIEAQRHEFSLLRARQDYERRCMTDSHKEQLRQLWAEYRR